MLFNSFEFIFLFFPVTLLVYWRLITKQGQRIWLLTISSYIFYAFWDYRFTLLMLSCTIVNYYCGKNIAGTQNLNQKKIWLSIALIISLGILGYFKYLNFFTQSVNNLLSVMGMNSVIPIINLILPVGISFFTFQALSYTIDVYRGEIKSCQSLITFSCFVSLFPQLVAGPIVRYKEIEKQLSRLKTKLTIQDSFMGIVFLVSGFAKKLIIADQIAFIINPYWHNYTELGFIGVWFIVIGYTYQIYFDFSGYSDMAVGLGRLLGLQLPRNFNLPYTAKNISDFWKRWHISLSKWLRDYLYIGLGGSYDGLINTFRNLMITMLLGGLWHGANWTFVFWGTYHGLLLVFYHILNVKKNLNFLSDGISRIITFIAVMIGWVFFRSESFTKAIFLLESMIGINGLGIDFWLSLDVGFNLIIIFILSVGLAHFCKDTWDIEWKPSRQLTIIMSSIAVLCVLMLNQASEFLYYQF